MKPEETNPYWRPGLPPDVEPGEAEILEAYRHWLYSECQNPDRKGCPELSRIWDVAMTKEKIQDLGVLEHISQCLPCYQEWSELLAELRRGGWFDGSVA